jgi:hypothetical protein
VLLRLALHEISSVINHIGRERSLKAFFMTDDDDDDDDDEPDERQLASRYNCTSLAAAAQQIELPVDIRIIV